MFRSQSYLFGTATSVRQHFGAAFTYRSNAWAAPFHMPYFSLANLKVPNKLLAPTEEEDMPINNTNAFYEVHKGLNLDRSHWYTLIEGQNGRFVIYEYDDYKVAANEPEGCEMIPLETFLLDGKFDATAQLKLRRLLEDEVIQEETA